MPRHITQLTVANVKRIVAVQVTPDGKAVIIGGENDQGKSSLLDSIMYAINGGRSLPEVPIRRGEKSGKIELKLSADGDDPALVVTRYFDAKGSRVEVKLDHRGAGKQPQPQALLDSLCSRIAFDPMAFTRAKPADQLEQLKGLVGLDFTKQDAKRATLYAERTEANREAKSLKSQLDATERYEDAPAEEVSVAGLMAELAEAQAANRTKENAEELTRQKEQTIADRAHDAKILNRALEVAKQKLLEAETNVNENHKHRKAAKVEAEALRNAAAKMPTADCEPIQERIYTADGTNAKVRANVAHTAMDRLLGVTLANVAELSDQIIKIDDDKQVAMESAEWPVEGIGFSNTGVTLDGLPFEQGSQSDQTRVSVAMGFAANPKLRVMLIRDASLLGDQRMQQICDLAEKYDGQVWMERVGEGDDCTVVIEDGRVKEQTEESEAEA